MWFNFNKGHDGRDSCLKILHDSILDVRIELLVIIGNSVLSASFSMWSSAGETQALSMCLRYREVNGVRIQKAEWITRLAILLRWRFASSVMEENKYHVLIRVPPGWMTIVILTLPPAADPCQFGSR